MDLSVGIIGYGKLGSAFSRELNKHNLLKWVVCMNNSQNNELNNIPFFNSLNQIKSIPDIILMTVQDSKLSSLVDDLVNSDLDFSNTIIAHCSGFLRIDILQKLREKNALIASIHPFQTFYNNNETNFKGIFYGIECDEIAKIKINKLIQSIDGNPFFFNDDNIKFKEFYHLSAVAVSNFLTPILQLGRDFANLSGINPNDFFLPIINQTIENNLSAFQSGDFPLTGTISRGDTNAYLIHLNKLNSYPHQKQIFKHLSLATIHSAYYNNIINEETYKKFIKISEEN